MRIAFDTNVLVYAEGIGDARRRRLARDIIDRLDAHDLVIPVQVLGELHRVLVRKTGRTPDAAKAAVLGWSDSFDVVDTTAAALLTAVDLAADHRVPIWDALILTAASDAGCRLLLSEDYQNGFTWRGVTVLDPFKSPLDDLLAAILR